MCVACRKKCNIYTLKSFNSQLEGYFLQGEEFPEGGEANGPAAADHCLRPVRLCPRPGALPLQEQPTEVPVYRYVPHT
jgi:hypothetical protein